MSTYKKSYNWCEPLLQKAQGNDQNQLTGQGNDRNEDMTFAQHLAEAMRLSLKDYEKTERLEYVPTYLVSFTLTIYYTQRYWVHIFAQKLNKIFNL